MASTSPPPSAVTANHALGEDPSLSPLEQEVLDEYARLLGNMNTVSCAGVCLAVVVLFSSLYMEGLL